MMLFLLGLWLNVAQAIEPGWKYQVLKSPHFELIYRADQKDLAKRYIVAAEQAHELLFPIFKEGPSNTIIVLRDDTDSANGSANFLPYPHITIYPVLPSTLDSVDEYGDWPLELMVHEYAHILNMHPAHGIYVPLKYIFGTIIRPNAVLPRWWLEGLAVNLESSLSTHGRLKSAETQGSARALILDKKFAGEDLSRINEGGINTWPYGARPYLYGAWWWDQASREKGMPLVETWNQNYARRLPFFLNGPVVEQVEKTADDYLRYTLNLIEANGQKQIDQIKTAGDSQGTSLAEDSGEQSIFALSPDGNKLVYWLSRATKGTEVRLKIRATAGQSFQEVKSERLFKAVGGLRLRWIDDSRFVFDQLDIAKPDVTYRDLYLYDLTRREKTRLTTDARAQEAAPRGDKIAFIQNEGGRNRLALLDLQTKSIRPLLNGNTSQRLSWPEFISDDEIVFSLRQKSGVERLHVVNIQSKKIGVWNEQLNGAQNPRLAPAGLLVTDTRTNARNAYLIKDGQAAAVTNTLTDIQFADFDPQRNELLISELTGDGRRLKAVPFKNFAPPVIAKPEWAPPPKALTSKVKIEEESFQPLDYLLPRYWMPFVYQVENGLMFQGLTANQDPIGRNQYTLLASYDTVTRKPSFGVGYVNRSTTTDIGLNASRSVSYLGASGLTLNTDSAALSLSPQWPFNSRFHHWSLAGLYAKSERGPFRYERLGPEVSWTYSRLKNPLNERFGYHLEWRHRQNVELDDYLHYGRSYAHLATQVSTFGDQRVFFQARGSVAPDQPFNTITTLGDRNIDGVYVINLVDSPFLLRGYPSGTFVGRKMLNANLEYVLPLTDFDRGYGSLPFFLRGLEMALFTDLMAVDGAGYDRQRNAYARSSLSENYLGSGAELRLNTTAGYHIPINLTLGLYYGHSERFSTGFSPFFSIGFGGLNPLDDKTP